MIEIFDGAMGTMLQAGGLKPGACPELMNLEHPDVVKKIHEAYIDAGSTIITTNTFGASRLKLEHYGLSNRVAELNRAAVEIAKSASKNRVKVVEIWISIRLIKIFSSRQKHYQTPAQIF